VARQHPDRRQSEERAADMTESAPVRLVLDTSRSINVAGSGEV